MRGADNDEAKRRGEHMQKSLAIAEIEQPALAQMQA